MSLFIRYWVNLFRGLGNPKSVIREITSWSRRSLEVCNVVVISIFSMIALLSFRYNPESFTADSAEYSSLGYGSFYTVLYLIPPVIILSIFFYYVSGFIFKVAGSWVGSKVSFLEARTVLVFAQLPAILYYLIFILAFFTFSSEGLIFEYISASFPLFILWSSILLLVMFSEIGNISIWRVIGQLAISVTTLIVFSLVMFLSFFFVLLVPFSAAGALSF